MLTQLYIKNFALIDELDIPFEPGFSVITGETGAGKSIILGALGLVMGQRADVKAIKHGTEKCTVEAHFNIEAYDLADFFERNDIDYDPADCILRREINASGKSRAFVNDVPVALGTLKELGERLVDIHSQHQNLLLGKEDFQLGTVDLIAQNAPQLADYAQVFSKYQAAQAHLRELETQLADSREREEYLRFQCGELEEAQLQAGQQEELEQEVETVSHAEEIKAALYLAVDQLDGENTSLLSTLRTLAARLHDIETLYPGAKEAGERIDNCYIELKDLARELGSQVDEVEFDPARLETINSRLDTLYSLERKYRVETVDELLALRDNLRSQLQRIDHGDEELRECQAQVDRLLDECRQLAQQLTLTRREAATRLETALQGMLVDLGIPKARFQIAIDQRELTATGHDRLSFLFSANSSTPMLPVSEVASGGEIARVMLSLKALVSHAVKLPTIIFDEIDTGVSGGVAEKMAHIMGQIAQGERQVIAITHLPQIAARGTAHYQVTKQETDHGTVSRMLRLDDEGRVAEIAKMLSGSNVSEAAIDNAKSLLNLSASLSKHK